MLELRQRSGGRLSLVCWQRGERRVSEVEKKRRKKRTNVIFSPTYSYTISILILSSSFPLPSAGAGAAEALKEATGAEKEVEEVVIAEGLA